MTFSIKHRCGHTTSHVLYGSPEQIARQRGDLPHTRCPDCFEAKVLRLTASSLKIATVELAQRRR